MMRIGEAADRSGVGVETVRFYENKGLIKQPLRPPSGGYRQYPAEIVERIRFIRSAQHIGFSLMEISELLDLEAARDSSCLEVRQRAEQKRGEVQFKIENLQRIEQALELLINNCPGTGSAQKCSILEAINTGDLHLRSASKGDCDAEQETQN